MSASRGVRMLDIDADVSHRRVQRHRQLGAVVRPPHAVPDPAGAGLRRGVPRAVGGVRGVQRGLRRGARRGGGRGRGRAGAGLPPGAGAADAARRCAPTCASATSRTPRGRPPDYFRLLPDDIAAELLRGILGADRAGVPDPALGATRSPTAAPRAGREVVRRRGTVTHGGRPASGCTGSAPTPTSCGHAVARAGRGRADGGAARSRSAPTGKAIVRVDRTELSKNIVRGLLAYRRAAATTTPSGAGGWCTWRSPTPPARTSPVYREYTDEVQRLAEEINDEFGTAGWQPVAPARQGRLRALAGRLPAGRRRPGQPDPRRHEPGGQGGPGASPTTACALVLSREAGAYEELGEDAIAGQPVRRVGHGGRPARGAVHAGRRARRRTKRLAAAATALPPQQWFLDQLHALTADAP